MKEPAVPREFSTEPEAAELEFLEKRHVTTESRNFEL